MEQDPAHIVQTNLQHLRHFYDQENWNEAHHLSKKTLELARQLYEKDPVHLEEFAFSLEMQGDLLRQSGELEEAKKHYLDASALLENKARFTEALARISASLAVLFDSLEDLKASARYYQRSIELFNRLDPPSYLDIINLSNNLAFIYRNNGNIDKAETIFLEALEIAHQSFGLKSEETALLCNNLGALYSEVEHHQEARDMQQMALDGRIASLGTEHVDTAQSYANLAVTESQLQNHELAKEYFRQALFILEDQVHKAASDYATITSNYVHFLEQLGEEKNALALKKQAAKKIASLSD